MLSFLILHAQGSDPDADNSERLEELEAKNESLEIEVRDLRQFVADVRLNGDSSAATPQLIARVERAERIARTKTALSDYFGAQVQQLQTELQMVRGMDSVKLEVS